MRLHPLITITGPDGVGKTTLCRLLAAAVSPAATFKFPAPGTRAERQIRILLSRPNPPDPYTMQALQGASRREKRDEMIAALERGPVLCDRYSADSLIYGLAFGCSRRWLDDLRRQDLHEDLVICLVGPKRRTGGDSYDRDEKLHIIVTKLCKKLAPEEGWLLLRARETPEETAAEAIRELQKRGYMRHDASVG